MIANSIREQALKEIHEEEFRRAVDEYKQKLRETKWYHRIFPWKIIILRRDV